MPKMRGKKVWSNKSTQQTGPAQAPKTATLSSMMDQLSIGMVVDICRSDGRTHSAVVSKIRPEASMVDVEWFEANETKGKAIDFATLLRNNPSIAPLTYSQPTQPTKPTPPRMTQRIQPKAPEPKQTPKQASVEVKDPKPDAPATNKLTRKTVGQRQEKDVNANNNGKASVDVPMKVSNKLHPTTTQIVTDPHPNTYRMLDQLHVGTTVEISRSDGRTHSAVVSGIRQDSGMIDVEWFEANETKGKAIDFATLLRTNPNLVPPPPPAVQNENSKVNQTRVVLRPEPKELPKSTENRYSRPESKELPIVEQPPPIARNTKTSRQTIHIAKDLTQQPPVVMQKLPEPTKSIRKSLAPVSKHQVVLKNEEIERQRIERRAQQAEERRMRDDLRGLDPGNPNWEFFKMIRDYRAGLDFRPLQASDHVIDDRICVCVRKRPLSKKEKTQKEIEIVTIPTKDQIHLHQPKFHVDMTKYLDNQKFRFDYTFDDHVDNEMVYRFTAQPLVDTIFQGGFATCFAYGQTGSGKTHTMGGDFEGKTQDCSKGIYALCATDVFNYLDSEQYRHLGLYVVCSFFELYGSKPFDLLAKRAERRILEDKKKNVQIVGLKEVEVSSAADVLKLIREGSMLRTAGQTSANANSSRSHAVFQIVLKREENSIIHGKFSLIDLAGSERGADTKGSESVVRREGGEINKSLLALKECIRSMGMMKKHVPFRQSKLTLVLRDSFIGKNAKTCMIATISPGLLSAENTLNTLRYANRAKELDSEAVDELNYISEGEDDEEEMEMDDGQYSD